MKPDKKKLTIAIIAFIIIIAITISGLIWTITQGIRSAKFAKTVAAVISCETEKLGDEDVNVKVIVNYEADGELYENASYIGDLSRCYEGLQMQVYYLKDGDRSFVYSKSSDLGFALIMLCCGVVWSGIAVVVTICLRNAGYFRGADKNDSGE